jgi:hypothetical protein
MMAQLETIRVALPNGWTLARDLAGGWAWIRTALPQPQALGSRNVLPLRQPTTKT